MKTLKIALVSSHKENENDYKLRSVLEKLPDAIKEVFDNAPFSELDFVRFTFNDEPELLAENCIATVNPSKYLQCKAKLGEEIHALLAVKKSGQAEPYYPAFFIANKESGINSIRSKEIKRLYAVSKSSTSGYVSALYKLWEAGIIESPNERGLEKRQWELVLTGSHKEVEQRILEDKEAIGATGQFTNQQSPALAPIKVVLRYYYLPQDVLTISKNLVPFADFLQKWFKKLFDEGCPIGSNAWYFAESSSKITGFADINIEFSNALEELWLMNNRVIGDIPIHSLTEIGKPPMRTQLSFKEHLRELVAEDKLSSVIDSLKEHFKDINDDDNYNRIVMQSARIARLRREIDDGLRLANDEQTAVEFAQITKAIINTIEYELQDA